MDPSLQPQQPQQSTPVAPQPLEQFPPAQPTQQMLMQAAVQQQPVVTKDPNAILGIVGLIVAFFAGPIGMAISAIAFIKSKKAGFKNTAALIGIILGLIMSILSIALIVLLLSSTNNAINDFRKDCDLKNGTTIDAGGGTYRCEYKIYR